MPSPVLPSTVPVPVELLRKHIEELDKRNDRLARATGEYYNCYPWLEELRALLPENQPCPRPPTAR